MPEPPLDYSVLVADEPSLRPPDIARALAAHRRAPFQDVMRSVRRCWGIIEEKRPKHEAEALAEVLSRSGVAALAVPCSLVEDLPPLERRGGLDLAERSLWSRLTLIGAACFTVAAPKTSKAPAGEDPSKRILKTAFTAMTGLPTGMGLPKPPVSKPTEASELSAVLDLVISEPPSRLRVDASRFDYSCLSGKMVYDALGNFRLLLAELSGAAPKARLSRGARILLEKRPVREMGYDGPEDLERECRWLMTLSALQR